MIKINMSSNLLIRWLRPDTYSVVDDYDEQIEQDKIDWDYFNTNDTDKILEAYWKYYDHDKYKDFLYEQFKSLYEWELLEFLKEKSNGAIQSLQCYWKLNSPKEYNFSTDWISFTIGVNKKEFIKFVRWLDQTKLWDFIYKEYTSYDWFMSFTANRLGELYEWLENNSCQEYWAVINYLLQDEDKYWTEDIDWCGMYSEFVDDKFFEEYGSNQF
jgi:hypothetical protein